MIKRCSTLPLVQTVRAQLAGFANLRTVGPRIVGKAHASQALKQWGHPGSRRSFFAASRARFASSWPTTYLTPEEVKESFEAYDLDGDGFITSDEMRSVLKKFGGQTGDERICNAMETMDTNLDGRIDFQEFASFWLGINQLTAGDDKGDASDTQSLHFSQSQFSSIGTLLEYCADQHKRNLIEGSKFESYMRLTERFKSIDLDGDGLLSPTELFSGLAIEHPTFSPRRIGVIVRRMLHRADLDSSGNIDLYEFTSQFLDKVGIPEPQHSMEIAVEETPNPRTMKFVPDGHQVLGPGLRTKTFKTSFEAADSPLAAAIFKVEGVQEVMLAGMHVTVMKSVQAEWDDLEDSIKEAICHFFASGLEVVKPGTVEPATPEAFEPGSIEERIMEVLEERVKPFVQQDGGDVAFDRFDRHDGSLYLMMQGSCSGCAQSHATLQIGVKNLMDFYVPEVKMIVGLQETEEEDLPRAR